MGDSELLEEAMSATLENEADATPALNAFAVTFGDRMPKVDL